MLYRTLGKTGIKISAFSLGSWITFDQCLKQSEVNQCVGYAFDQGVNLIDTAELYGEGRVESVLGKALADLDFPRDKYTVCTKVFWGGNSPTQIGLHRKHLIEGCNHSLKRLGLDYVDFYLCHRADMNTSIEEVVIGMNILIQQGKILYWGTSEWPHHLILEAYYIAKQMHLIPPSIEQFEYNLFCRERAEKMIPALQSNVGLGTMITMPLARGLLSGRYNNTIEDSSRAALKSHSNLRDMFSSKTGEMRIEKVRQMSKVAESLHITPAQLSLAWCLLNQHVHTVILGASSLSQLKENLGAINVVQQSSLTSETIHLLEAIFNNKPEAYYEPSYADVTVNEI